MKKKELEEFEEIEVQSNLEGWVELTAPSREEHIDRFENLFDKLYKTHISDEDKEELKFVIGEICRNAIEWGNKKDAKRKINVSYCLFEEQIVFKIVDEGEGFDPDSVPDPTASPINNLIQRDKDGKRVGGYGIFLIKNIMDKVIYSEKGNSVILSKYLSK